MRSSGGGVQLQQGLSAEAAMIVKEAVTLAKRRGHGQVTPLHVANTMLASPNALLRTACLQYSESHSHPLHCKALELCFNVALNRLPAASSSNHSPIFATTLPVRPSISNALLAAFKRAQAHQRRGSHLLDTTQPVLGLKIESEQLVISILDDPSVSRVMREAGFSSTLVKLNVEQALDQLSSHHTPNINAHYPTTTTTSSSDVWSVIDSLMSERRRRGSSVVVGECVGKLEGVVRGVMGHESMRAVQFISLSPSARLSKPEVDNKIQELKRLANTTPPPPNKRGFLVLYVGDLKYWAPSNNSYSAVDHMIKEVGKLVSDDHVEEGVRFRVMGIATFQTFIKCKNGHPSLHHVWGLHPLTIPAGTLRFTLTHTYSTCGVENESAKKKGENERKRISEEEKQPQVPSLHGNSASSTPLPAWLQHSKNHNNTPTSNHQVGDLCKKWDSSVCSSPTQIIHKEAYDVSAESSLSPTSSPFSYNPPHHQCLVAAAEPEQPPRDHSFWGPQAHQNHNHNIPTLRLYIPEHNNHVKQPLLLTLPSNTNPSSNPNSTSSISSSEAMEREEYVSKFKEVSSENLKTLLKALEKQVPWQKDVLPEIVSTILQCRSGMLRRKDASQAKQDTWLFFQGADVDAIEKIGRELGRLIFGGCRNNLVEINMKNTSFSSSSTTLIRSSDDDHEKKRIRIREEEISSSCCSNIETLLAEAVCRNPHRVFMLQDIEESDYRSQMGLKTAFERGRFVDSNGKQVCLRDAIIILTSKSSRATTTCSPSVKQKSWCQNYNNDNNKNMATLDLNISIDDGCDEDRSDVDDNGILESVDRRIIFQIQD